MFKRAKFIFVAFLSGTMLWVLTMFISEGFSPIFVQSEWIQAVENKDEQQVSKWSVWEGKPLGIEEAKALIDTLHKRPNWKKKIYRDLQRQAVDISLNQIEFQPWFQLVQPKGELAYKIYVPSIYMQIESAHLTDIYVLVGEDTYHPADKPIGPLLPVEQTIQFKMRNNLGVISEDVPLKMENLWGEQMISIIPQKNVSYFHIDTNSLAGKLYVDGKFWGNLEDNAKIGPITYTNHEIALKRDLPWGSIQSENVIAKPRDKNILLPINPINDTLIEQLGGALINYNNGWVDASKEKNTNLLTSISPELRTMITEIIKQKEDASFNGEFLQIILFPESITIIEPNINQFIAKVIVREDYINGNWIDSNGEVIMSYPSKQFWQYTLKYADNGGWEVSNFQSLEETYISSEKGIVFHGGNVLRIGVDAGFPPFEYRTASGQLRGLDIALMEQLGEDLGIKIIWKDRPLNQLYTDLEHGEEIDGIISAIDEQLLGKDPDKWRTIPYVVDEKTYYIVFRPDLEEVTTLIVDKLKQIQKRANASISM